MRAQNSVLIILSTFAGLSRADDQLENRQNIGTLVNDIIGSADNLVSDVVSSLACSNNKLAALMKSNAASAATFCLSSVGVAIKTPTATVTTKPTR